MKYHPLNYLDPIALYVVQPVVATLAILSLMSDTTETHILSRPVTVWACIILLQMIFAEDIWSFATRSDGRRRLGIVWLKMVGAGICGILVFAAAYHSIGLLDQGALSHDPWTAVYFSITAWSTVGYGDVLPTVAARPLAAAQALIGLLYDSALIGLILYASTQKNGSSRSEDQSD